MAESAGVPVARMEAVVDTVDERFPGLKSFMTKIESRGAERKIKEGEAYVITPIGRRLPADEGKIYALVNYYLQSWAADVLKKSLVRLDAAGYDEFMILPVHDEIVMDIPAAYAEQALRDVPLIMQETGPRRPADRRVRGSAGPLGREVRVSATKRWSSLWTPVSSPGSASWASPRARAATSTTARSWSSTR